MAVGLDIVRSGTGGSQGLADMLRQLNPAHSLTVKWPCSVDSSLKLRQQAFGRDPARTHRMNRSPLDRDLGGDVASWTGPRTRHLSET